MKKLLLSLFTVLFFTIAANAQCINTGQFPNNDITINNDGNPNDINTCVFTGDFSQLVNAIVGDDYRFTLTGNAGGADKYITVTDGSDAVIAFGESPLTVLAITSATIRVHYTEDAACNTESLCHTATYQNVSACVAPSNLVATPTDSTAQLGWTPGSIETSWEVEVVLAGATPTGAGVTVTSPTYTATGLTANTNYDFYVRSDCGGGDFSIWVGPSTFLTLPTCPATGDPFLINLFNDGSEIAWFANGSETMWDVEYGPTGFVQGTGTLVEGLTSESYLISGQMPDTTYDAYVRAVCDGNDLSPWSNVVTYTTLTSCPRPSALFATNVMTTSATISWLEGQSETMWELEYGPTGFVQGTGTIISTTTNPHALTGLNADTTYDVYVRAECGVNDYSIWIGPETFTTLPTCPQPTNLFVDNVLTTSAIINWTLGQAETAWELEYGPAGFVQGTGTIIMTTANPYNLTGLIPATSYDIYVRADCGAPDGFSQWTGPVTFTTECVTFVAPYTEGFENGGSIPNCWSQGAANAEDWIFDLTAGHVGDAGTITGTTATNGYFAYVDDSFADNVGTTLVSPLVDVSGLTTPALSFYLISNNETNSNVNFSVDFYDGALWNTGVFTSNTNTAGGWTQIFIDLSTYTITGDVQARFIVDEPANGDFYDDIAIDDVTFDELPDCTAPTALIAGTTTADSVDLSWTAGAAETAWELEYGLAGFTQGTGTIVPAGTNPFTLTGLMANTTYDVYVRANCGADGFSAWAGPAIFTTACTQFTAPYSEGFENGGTIPNCWTQGGANAEDWLFDNDPGFNHIGNNGTIVGTTATNNYFAWIDDSFPQSLATTLISPFVDVTPLTNPALSFYLLSDNEGNTNVDFSVDFYDGAAWNVGVYASSTNTGGWTQIFIDLSPYTITGNVQARFIVDENNGGDFYDDIALDDVSFDELPSCAAPTALTSGNNTSSGADLSWAPGAGETAWEIVIQAPGTGLPPGAGTAITTNPYMATGLTSSTSYEYYVRANCGADGFSDWAGPLEFSTTPEYCAGDAFVDSGGVAGDYSNGENVTYTICPDNPGDVVYVNFTAFSAEDAFNGCFDGLTIYDGGDTTASLIVPPNGTDIWCWDRNDNPPTGTGDLQGLTLISTDASGCLTFVFTSDGSVTRPGWEAAVTCAAPPSCPAPSDVLVTGVTATDADIAWTENGTSTNWEIEYGPAGFVQGTGTLVQVTANPYAVTGLNPATTYEAYVRSDCSGGAGTDLSIWSSPATFTTDCATLTPMYLNDFSAYLGNCWEEGNDTDIATGPNNTDGAWGDDGFGNVGATGSARINLWNLGDSDWIVSPTFDLSAGGYELKFKVALTEFANTNAATLGSDDEVQLLVSESGGAWTNLMTWDATSTISTTGDDVTVDLVALTGADVKFAFWATEGTVDDAADNDFFIDDFLIDVPLSTNEFESLGFKYFPNPVKDELTLVSQSDRISHVKVMNLLGQHVLSVTPNVTRTHIDLSNLEAGAYLINVTINNKSENIRIIKD